MSSESVASLYGGPAGKRVRTRDLLLAKERGEKWAMLTSYDQYTAQIFDEAGIPVLLVGDSAANNIFGYPTTLPVTVDELLRHPTRPGRR
jgi:3-methyl-2-oxobutanoate hydroxymethyltransferase